MKKLILSAILPLLLFSILLIPSYFDKVYAQDKETLGCEELVKLLGSEECKFFANEEYSIWCAQTNEELITTYIENGFPRMNRLYLNRDPDYLVDRSLETREEFNKCWGETPEEQEKNLKKEPAQQVKQSKSSQNRNPFNIFGVNPYQTWLNIKAVAELGAFVQTGGAEQFTETVILHGAGIEPTWEREAREEEIFNQFLLQAAERITELEGKGATAENNDTIETTGDHVIIKKDSAIINLQPQAGEKGVLEAGDKPTLKSGAVDVIVEPQKGEQFEMQTPNAEIFVIGTEFSVIYGNKKNKTIVAVYKGKVEVKARDGQITTVSPNGDKPGVVVVTQKLSLWKLALAGLVLMVIIGGAILILRRKIFSKTANKKKR